MRILHFVSDIGISNGVMSFIINYGRVMQPTTKFDIAYFNDTEKNHKEYIESLGCKTYKVPKPSFKKSFFRALKDVFEAHKNEYEAVHIHLPYLTALIYPIAKKNRVKKIIAHCHTNVFSLNPRNNLRNRIMNIPTKYIATMCLAPSKSAGKLWFGKKYRILYNAIDCSTYKYDEEKRNRIRKELGIEESFVIAHIGQTTIRQKNHLFLMRAFKTILETKPDSKLILIGGKKTQELDDFTEKIGVTENIIYLGIQKNVSDFLMAADAFVFPSTSEGLAIAVIEAQTTGLPCVVSDRIPDEVCITSNVKKLSLNCTPEEWARTLFEMKEIDRLQMYETVKKKGWDIESKAEELEYIYEGGNFV